MKEGSDHYGEVHTCWKQWPLYTFHVLDPDIEETLQSLLTKTCVPVEAMLQLDLKPIKVDGE